VSQRDQRRRRWCRKHKAIIRATTLQLNRRPPYRYRKVWCVDYMIEDGSEIIATADWGMTTRRKAIDKAMREKAKLDRDVRRATENELRYEAMLERL